MTKPMFLFLISFSYELICSAPVLKISCDLHDKKSKQEIKKGIDARELKKNPSYRARQVAKSSELSKNIKL